MLTTSDERARVTRVLDDGPARAGGFAPGARVVAADGLPVRGEALAPRGARRPRTRPVTFHVLRDDRLLERPVPLRPAPRDSAHRRPSEEGDAAGQRRRPAWLEGR
jgi:predicted metalloprotease with PDZ domain